MGATEWNLSQYKDEVNGEIDDGISSARYQPASANTLTSMALRLT
jgi:hypothetical protein